jgi:hypothetical protein
MNIIRWSAVLVTALFALMNLGVTLDPDASTIVRIGAGVLALAGVLAATGLARATSWGRPAVIAVGALNVAGGIAALVTDEPGAGVGIVVGGLAVLLAALTRAPQPARASA